MGTPGDMGTGSATPRLTCSPPSTAGFGHPQHPSQLLGCQHPNSPDLLQASPVQPPGSHGAPSPGGNLAPSKRCRAPAH